MREIPVFFRPHGNNNLLHAADIPLDFAATGGGGEESQLPTGLRPHAAVCINIGTESWYKPLIGVDNVTLRGNLCINPSRGVGGYTTSSKLSATRLTIEGNIIYNASVFGVSLRCSVKARGNTTGNALIGNYISLVEGGGREEEEDGRRRRKGGARARRRAAVATLLLVRGGGGDAPARAEGACFARQDVHSWKLHGNVWSTHGGRWLTSYSRTGMVPSEVPRVTRDLACAAVGVACDPLPNFAYAGLIWIGGQTRQGACRRCLIQAFMPPAGISRAGSRHAARQLSPDCTSTFGDDAGCSLNSSSPLSNSTVTALETTYLKSQDVKKRAGLLGCWLSHYALLEFADDNSVSEDAMLLILEDDVVICPELFSALPRLLSPPRDWHAVRLTTWGDLHEADRLLISANTTDQEDDELFSGARLYHAVHRIPHLTADEWLEPSVVDQRLYYMGTHAVLVERTVNELLSHMMACGASSPDLCAYKEGSPMLFSNETGGGGDFKAYALNVPELVELSEGAMADSDAGKAGTSKQMAAAALQPEPEPASNSCARRFEESVRNAQ